MNFFHPLMDSNFKKEDFHNVIKLLKTKNCQNDEKKTGKLSRTLALIKSSANLLFTSKINKKHVVNIILHLYMTEKEKSL